MKKLHTSLIFRLLTAVTALCLLLANQYSFAQGVGINTTTPDPSAALDIQSANKGLLIPHIYLNDVSDKTTIPSPAPGLLVYNTNKILGSLTGEGFYFNNGTRNLPNWININQFNTPYYGAAENDGATFQIDNYKGIPGSVAIKGFASAAGTAVYAENGENGYALIVDGKLKIVGANQTPGTGKVLTSDNSGNASWQTMPVTNKNTFKASGIKGGGSEKIADNVITKVPFAKKDFDPKFNYNDANGNPHSTFTAPVAGIYHFDVKVGTDPNVKIFLCLNREVAGVSTIELSEMATNPQISTNLKLDAGDRVFATVSQNSGGYINLITYPTASYFTGFLITEL